MLSQHEARALLARFKRAARKPLTPSLRRQARPRAAGKAWTAVAPTADA